MLLITSDNSSALPEKDALRQCERLGRDRDIPNVRPVQIRFNFRHSILQPLYKTDILKHLYIQSNHQSNTHRYTESKKRTYTHIHVLYSFSRVSVKVQTLLVIIELTRGSLQLIPTDSYVVVDNLQLFSVQRSCPRQRIDGNRHVHIEINEENDKTLHVKYNIFQY